MAGKKSYNKTSEAYLKKVETFKSKIESSIDCVADIEWVEEEYRYDLQFTMPKNVNLTNLTDHIFKYSKECNVRFNGWSIKYV